MSDAADKLAQTRLAIIAHLQGRERRHERPDPAAEQAASHAQAGNGQAPRRSDARPPRGPAGWYGHLKHVIGTWWRHHPASMGVDMATPLLSAYAERKPVQYLGIAAAIGAIFMVARPWRLISVTGLIVALVKSSQLSSLVLSAMAGADYGKDHQPPV